MVEQFFVADHNGLSGISLRFGTYRVAHTHQVVFKIYVVEPDRNHKSQQPGWVKDTSSHAKTAPMDVDLLTEGTLLFTTTAQAAGISDTDHFHLYFPRIATSEGRLFALTIASPDAQPARAITAWLTRDEDRIASHIGLLTGGAFRGSYGLLAKTITSASLAPSAFPEGLLYSPLSSCNMNCTHCISRHSRSRAMRISGEIKAELVQQAQAKNLKWMFTDYSGDILFAEHKHPGELDFILSLGIAIHIDTNGAYLGSEQIEKIMRSPVDTVSISVDAATDETYHRIRVGSPPIDEIFAAVRALVQARARHGRQDNFNICMGFTLMRSNLNELPLFIEKAAAAGADLVGCRHLEIYHADMERESLFSNRAAFNAMRPIAIAVANRIGIRLLIGADLPTPPLPRSSGPPPCMIPWGSAVVLANGDVMACCTPKSKMGNLTERSMEEIWQGKTYRALRTRVNTSDPPSLCRDCAFRGSLTDVASAEVLRAHLSATPLLEELAVGGQMHAMEVQGGVEPAHAEEQSAI